MFKSWTRRQGFSEGLSFFNRWVKWGERGTNGPLWAIAGVLANYREGRVPPELEDIIVPTKLSVFGLLNLQDATQDLPEHITGNQVALVLLNALGADFKKDLHVFSNEANFGLHEGTVKMRDAGGEHTLALCETHHTALRGAMQELTQLAATQCPL